VPSEQLQFFDQGFFHSSVVVVSFGFIIGYLLEIGAACFRFEGNHNGYGNGFPPAAFIIVKSSHFVILESLWIILLLKSLINQVPSTSSTRI